MADAGARRRNHWVNQLARHAHEKPHAVYLRFQGTSTTWGQLEATVVDVPEDSPALIMYTSGTTGRPKGAVLSHQNMQCRALTVIRSWRMFGDEEVVLCASPLFHIASLGAVAPTVLIGATTVLVPGAERIARYKLPTTLHVVAALPRNASGKVMKTALREQFR